MWCASCMCLGTRVLSLSSQKRHQVYVSFGGADFGQFTQVHINSIQDAVQNCSRRGAGVLAPFTQDTHADLQSKCDASCVNGPPVLCGVEEWLLCGAWFWGQFHHRKFNPSEVNVTYRGKGNKNWVYLVTKHALCTKCCQNFGLLWATKIEQDLVLLEYISLNKLNVCLQKPLKVTFAPSDTKEMFWSEHGLVSTQSSVSSPPSQPALVLAVRKSDVLLPPPQQQGSELMTWPLWPLSSLLVWWSQTFSMACFSSSLSALCFS